MAALTDEQIDLISAYIRQNGVAQDDLHADLLDHVCTSIENLMDEGVNFDDAFAKTIKLFGPGGLKQVQQYTFELLTEMNEPMKKVAFSFGLTSAILLLAGTIFKLMHWPGAGIMIVLGGALLALGYLPMLLVHKLKESPKGDAPMHLAGFVGLTLTTMGVVFKIMHWPGAGVILVGGMAIIGFLYIPIYFVKRFKSAANKPLTLSTSLVAFTCLVLVFALVNVQSSSQHERGSVLINLQLDEASKSLSDENAKLYELISNNEKALEVKLLASRTYNYLDSAKLHMVAEAHETTVDQIKDFSALDLRDKNNFGTPLHILWLPEPNEEHSMEQIIEKLMAFRLAMNKLVNADSNDMAMVQPPFPWLENKERGMDWAKSHFYRVQLSAVLAQITQLQIETQQFESKMLIHLISRSSVSDPPSGG